MKNPILLVFLSVAIFGFKHHYLNSSSIKGDSEDFLCIRLLNLDSKKPLARLEIEMPDFEKNER